MDTAIIAARSLNGVIGNASSIPWRVKGEQAMFKKITMGGILIMGRKTFDAIGRPLPGRSTIIITRNLEYTREQCLVCHSLESAVCRATTLDRPVFIAGGGEIYRQSLPLVNTVHLTTIQADFSGDTRFPDFPTDDFTLEEEQFHAADINYIYQRYQRDCPTDQNNRFPS